jgi:molecular chaperone GrpE (heat shock protein)
MNDELKTLPSSPAAEPDTPTLGMSSIYKLFEAFIALREKNAREHKMFEQTQARSRDGLQSSFNSFASETQKAFQSLRQEIHGEKRFALALLNELLDLAIEYDHILQSRPKVTWYGDEANAVNRWMESLEVQSRKIQASLVTYGIHPYDAVVGSPYNPALHERVGSKRMEGMGPLLIAESKERGWASQQPEFILRRPKVIVSD